MTESVETILKMLNQLMEDDVVDALNQWEQDFVYDVSTRISREDYITEKQRNMVLKIFNDKIVSTNNFTKGRFDCERR
jgi:hypothetical protein